MVELIDNIYSWYIVLNCTELDMVFINQHNGKKLSIRGQRVPLPPFPPLLRRLISVCDNYKLCANYVSTVHRCVQLPLILETAYSAVVTIYKLCFLLRPFMFLIIQHVRLPSPLLKVSKLFINF